MFKLFVSLCALITLSACSITIPNSEICSVAGVISAGADCAKTLSDETHSMNLDEWVAFLEPQLEGKTPEGVVIPARGAALCMSSEDYQKIKTALEQACYKLGHWCSKETKVEGEKASTRLTDLQSRVMEKKKEK